MLADDEYPRVTVATTTCKLRALLVESEATRMLDDDVATLLAELETGEHRARTCDAWMRDHQDATVQEFQVWVASVFPTRADAGGAFRAFDDAR